MPKINELLNRFSKKELRRFAIYLSVLFLLLVALLFNKAVFFILGFMVANVVVGILLIPLRSIFFSLSLGLLSAVTCGMAFGVKAGFLAGILVTIPKIIAQGNIGIYSIPPVLSYGLTGVIGGLLKGFGVEGIFTVGLIATIFHNLFTGLSIGLLMGGGWGKNILFWATNIPFNLFLFYFIAPHLLRVMI